MLAKYKWLIILIVVLLLVISSFIFGYKLNGWRNSENELKESKANITALSNKIDDEVSSHNALVEETLAANQKTADSMTALGTKLEDQSNAFRQIQFDLKGLDVGHCNFTPANDGMYQRAYEAAFGSTHQGSSSGQAGSSNAANPATAKTVLDKQAVSH